MSKRVSRRGRAVFWAGAAFCVPFSYASLYVADGGPQSAEGCSAGAGPMTETGVVDFHAEEQQQVGADAFVTFTAETRRVDAGTAFSGIALVVQDGGGNSVEGSSEVLRETPGPNGTTHLLIGWTPEAPRAAGETLTLHASATSNERTHELTSSLVVTTSRPVLALPEFDVLAWANVSGDRGTPISCPPSSNTCGVQFGEATYVGRSLTMSAAPVTDVTVAWEYRFDTVAGKGAFAEAPPLHAALPNLDFYSALHFSEVLDEYCVRITGRDLRTGDEQSREWCATPELPIEEANYDKIQTCPTPPPGFEHRWCAVKQNAGGVTPPECDAFLNPASSGGAAGESGSGATGGPDDPNDAGSGAVLVGAGGAGTQVPDAYASDDSGSRVRTNGGCGCSLTRRDVGHGTGLLVLALLGVSRRLRKGARLRPRPRRSPRTESRF